MPSATKSTQSTNKNSARGARKAPAVPRLSRLKRPDDISVEDWQVQLRRQFGREQSFVLDNLGTDPVFSEFLVTNPHSAGRYRLSIRGKALGENLCSCPDFATNDLGTCKHIEFALAAIEAKRGAKAAFKRGYRPQNSELNLDYAGARTVRFRLGADCPAALAGLARQLFDPDAGWALAPERFGQLPDFLAAAREAGHDVRCHDAALAFIAEARDADQRRRLIDQHYPQGSNSAALAGLLKIDMYPYQAEGALFAARAGRALIGDEMGLGKTIQAIAAAELMTRHFGVERVLVVCPTSLKHQWQREIARFSGRDAHTIHGLRALRQQQYRDPHQCKITNYETLARDLDLINGWAPDLIIVDEAQRIKNWNTIAARALKRIASPYAIVLTGTPLENRLEELLSIVQFVDLHRLGPTWRLLHEHQRRDDTGRVVGYTRLDRIGATLAPIMLRRRKAQVLSQLPARVDNTLFVPMTEQQRAHHDENAVTVSRIVLRWRKTGYLSDADQRRLTCSLQNMRMSCNSTFLLDHETDHGVKVDELVSLLEDLFEDPQAKVVIFSQWVRTHELIVRRLAARGWGHVLFHGAVPSEKRAALVDRFTGEADCRVFLSTDAGGVGLNLQHAAATIVNMDLPWNPAVLEQRIGRVYRLGQTRSVQVVNFVSKGTIEEGMLSILSFKKSLFSGVLDGGESDVFMNGPRLSQFMESVEQVTGTMGEAESVDDAVDDAADVAADAAQDDVADVADVADVTDDAVALVPDALPVGTEVTPTVAQDGGTGQSDVEQLAPYVAAQADGDNTEAPARAAPPSGGDPWAPLIDVGLHLIETLSAAHGGKDAGNGATQPSWIETDAASGKSYVKFPVPEPETVRRLADTLAALLAGLKR